MFLSAIALSAFAAYPQPSFPAGALRAKEDRIEWFRGGFEEARAEVARTEQYLFVNVCVPSSSWCARLDAVSFSHPGVVAKLKAFVCVYVDGTSVAGTALTKKYGVGNFPTMLFFEPDGEVRDLLRGYVPPRPFTAELTRILSGEGTITALRSQLKVHPEDVDTCYELARKLSKIGVTARVHELVETIRRLDPDGKSLASRSLAMDEAAKALEGMSVPSDERFRELLLRETNPRLLYTGWSWIYRIDDALARSAPDELAAASWRSRAREAVRAAWPHCPDAERTLYGNEVAWWLYGQAQELSTEEKKQALNIAREVVQLDPTDPNLRDTYACCLYMNGLVAEAIVEISKSIEMEPENPEWKARLEEFERR